MSVIKLGKSVRLVALFVAVTCFVLAASDAISGDKKGPAIGDRPSRFTLEDYSGKEHKLSKQKDKIVVLVFSSQECPWSRAVDLELPAIAKQYADKDVVFFAIDSHKDTKPSEIAEYAKKTKLTFPVLKDEKNLYADKLQATTTPEFYILDKAGKLAYHGAFDNRKAPKGKGSENYVVAALDSLLAGKKVAKAEVKSWGCGIKRVAKADAESAPKPAPAPYGSGSKY